MFLFVLGVIFPENFTRFFLFHFVISQILSSMIVKFAWCSFKQIFIELWFSNVARWHWSRDKLIISAFPNRASTPSPQLAYLVVVSSYGQCLYTMAIPLVLDLHPTAGSLRSKVASSLSRRQRPYKDIRNDLWYPVIRIWADFLKHRHDFEEEGAVLNVEIVDAGNLAFE